MKIHERVKKASWARGGERREGGRIDYGGRGGGEIMEGERGKIRIGREKKNKR